MQMNSYWIVFVKCSFPINRNLGSTLVFTGFFPFLLLSVRKDACCCRWWGDITNIHFSPWFTRLLCDFFVVDFTLHLQSVLLHPLLLLLASLSLSIRGRGAASQSDALSHLFDSGRRATDCQLCWKEDGMIVVFYAAQRGPRHTCKWGLRRGPTCASTNRHPLPAMCHVWVSELPAVGSRSQRTEPRPAVYVCSPSVSVSEQHFSTTEVRGEVERLRISSVKVDERQSKRRDGWTASSYQISPTLSQTCSHIVLQPFSHHQRGHLSKYRNSVDLRF